MKRIFYDRRAAQRQRRIKFGLITIALVMVIPAAGLLGATF
jgi:hypothetical protein